MGGIENTDGDRIMGSMKRPDSVPENVLGGGISLKPL